LTNLYVKRQFSPDVLDRIRYYNDLIDQGYWIQFYFISTGRDDNEQGKDLAATLSKEHRWTGIEFHLLDFPALKEFYIEAQTLEQSIPERVSIKLGSGRWLLINKPRRTLIDVVKANSLVNLCGKEREELFAYNIRSFLGRKGLNKDIMDTREERPEAFFLFH
jgi:hypothetical protein